MNRAYEHTQGEMDRAAERGIDLQPYTPYLVPESFLFEGFRSLINVPGGFAESYGHIRGAVRNGNVRDTSAVLTMAFTVGLGAVLSRALRLPRAPRGPLAAGEAGRFADLDALASVGDQLTPHHMPQAALEFTPRSEGGALVMSTAEHRLTRTFMARGRATALAERGMPFRDVLARDIRDLRRIVGPRYDPGIRNLLRYYRASHPDLIRRPSR